VIEGGFRSRQLPLDLGHAQGHSRDDLIVTAANAEAVAHVERWPDWPTTVTVLAGPAGSGKSHLGAIWRELSGALQIGGSGATDAARQRAANGTPVFIDDADSGACEEVDLFHLINAARGAGSTMLLTARRFPSAWGVSLPDLASRLKAATVVEIREPDDALLHGVMAKLFADRQVAVEPQVLQFVARRIERSLATANAVVARLDTAALERQSRITRALAAEVIAEFDGGQAQFDF